jgi:hypothetical protein
MKCKILITGQINGNFRLEAKMRNFTDKKRTMFNGFALFYDSKKEAQNDLRRAFKEFIENDELKNVVTYRHRDILRYDASKAEIHTL